MVEQITCTGCGVEMPLFPCPCGWGTTENIMIVDDRTAQQIATLAGGPVN